MAATGRVGAVASGKVAATSLASNAGFCSATGHHECWDVARICQPFHAAVSAVVQIVARCITGECPQHSPLVDAMCILFCQRALRHNEAMRLLFNPYL